MSGKPKAPQGFAVGQYSDPRRIESPTLERFLERFDTLRREFDLDIGFDEITDRWEISELGKQKPLKPVDAWVTPNVAAKWEGK